MSNDIDRAITTEQAGDGAFAPDPTATPETTQPTDSGSWSDEQLQDLKEKASKAQEHWDRFVRVSADFDNYKKRAARERQDAVRFANESLLSKLIPLLDNFEMALAATSNAQANTADALKTGVSMIYNQLRSVLAEAGLEEIDATGKPFDPNWHEAVSQQSSDTVPEGYVLQQLRKGYKLNDRLIRPATVVVAKNPAA